MLFFRMLFTVAVNLYTSRVVLAALGVQDFGIYIVVGGVVAMLSFLNGAMTSATQRFLSFELGQKSLERLRLVFSMSRLVHAGIALAVLILLESAGVWLLNAHLVIPADRIDAANFIFQTGAFSLILSILSVPYSAAIVAHERMHVLAWVGIGEVLLKLLVATALQVIDADKLKTYGTLLLVVTFLSAASYVIYCRRQFAESRFSFDWDGALFKALLRHSSWMLLGTSAYLLSSQGVNIALNIFFGPGVNAARGIALQLQSAIVGLVSSYTMAAQPQIIKLYSQNDVAGMNHLVFVSSKYSFFILYLLSLPILIEADALIGWWLKVVPDDAVLFGRLTILDVFFTALFPAIAGVSQAVGRNGVYQSVIASGFFATFAISYSLFALGAPASAAFMTMIAMSAVGLCLRLMVLRRQAQFPVADYLRAVLMKIARVISWSLPLPLLASYAMGQSAIEVLTVCAISAISVLVSVWFAGADAAEKAFARQKLRALWK